MGYIINPKDIPNLEAYQCDAEMATYLLYTAKIPLLGFVDNDDRPYLFAITDKLRSALSEYKKYKANELGKELE